MFQPVVGRTEAMRPVEHAPSGAIDLIAVLSSLWRGRRMIILAAAGMLVAVALFALFARPQYVATTELLIDPADLRVVENELTSGNQTNDAAVIQVESQVRVLTSENVLRRVIAKEQLDQDPEFARKPSALRLLGRSLLPAIGINQTSWNDDPTLLALNELQRHLRVRRAERTYVVDVTVASDRPEKSARIANAIADAYLAEQTAARAETARRVSESLSARLSELKDRVREAEERAEAFKSQNNILAAGGQLVNEQQLQELNSQLQTARAHTEEAKSRFEQVERAQQSGADGGSFTEAVQSQTMNSLRGQYAEIMRREADQTTTLGPRHPAVFEVQAEAQRLKHLIADEINRIALATRNEYERARANEESLARSFDGLKTRAMTTNEALVTLRELEREVQASRALYESFLARSRETGAQERLDTNNIRVISRADLPLGRSWPPSNMILGLGALLLGLAAGGALVLWRAWRGESAGAGAAKTSRPEVDGPPQPREIAAGPEPARETAGLPLLAVLPSGMPIPNGTADRKSRFAADMRRVIETVRASHTQPQAPRILVVSPQQVADTTMVALQLAAAAAATQRVLLIDADMHERTLSAIVPGESDAGLVDVAVGRKALAEAVMHDARTNINIMPLVSPKSFRLGRMRDADIEAAFDQTGCFDLVIVAGGTHDSDPAVRFFAGLVDHVVLVVAAGMSGQGDIDQLTARLALDPRKIRGTVLTGAKS
jgi:uncharacterized protein involved in exopolysaccharide biosynthesis/Mrp family chromosome partitioning ATPase